ncbi:DNA-binding protein HEXBP-like [Impatiens glandulifera]|uniref:DNA-binding protein HEXBP-like n=1 Tax=Impatiens glandulifera TaxID=253017 RepID=UPI001FB13E4F|nr:DNA-binding protein HEXBP-like [Impatiens glandulifera]
MVSKRQVLARRAYKQQHPELFPKPEPPVGPTKKQIKKEKRKSKEKSKSKRRDLDAKSKPNRGPRVLRVPGMKPGESCFICKAFDHIAKLCPRKEEWEKHKICLLCRRHGHSLKNCPNKTNETNVGKLCYNCGETGHSLDICPLPRQDGGVTFASCFICKEQGHLSKDCPKNTHGIYPKGGSCKICGGVTHLARDCPDIGLRNMAAGYGRAYPDGEMRRPKVTKFASGDDLEDDFTPAGKGKVDESMGGEDDNIHIKEKKEKGPKIVNFV